MKASALQSFLQCVTGYKKSKEKATSIKESEDEETTEKKEKVDLFVFLSDDILLDILKRHPEAFLGYKAKYVCRRWLDLISNRILLDRASFILQDRGNLTARHVGIREEGEEGLQVKVQDLDIPPLGMIESWGNEFVLISYYKRKKGKRKRTLYVYNLITKEGSYLPKCKAPCGGYCRAKCGVALSFDGFKGIYKVVHLFTGPPIKCRILTLRKDIVSSKWDKIQLPCTNGGWWLYHNPVIVQGRYIHWEVYRDKRLISMDMVKEEIVDISLPLPCDHTGGSKFICYTIFEMGGTLALFSGETADKAEIWILKDFQMKKWEKLQSVTLENWHCRRFAVCGVISNNKYIILESQYCYEGMWYYDLKNGVLKKLAIHFGFGDRCVVHSSPPRGIAL